MRAKSRTAVALLLLGASLHAASLADLPPLVSISVNGTRSAEITRGMPLLVTVVLIHPLVANSAATPILLAAENGPWTNAVRFEISDANGDVQSWPFHSTVNPSNTLVLDSFHSAQLSWWLAPEQTQLLSTGKYSAKVTLNTTNVASPEAWKGVVETVPASLQVLDQPLSLSEAQAENRCIQLTQYQLFQGNADLALAQVNQLLTSHPTNISGLRLKSIVLDATGRTLEAHSVCEQALAEAYARNPNALEPPLNLLAQRKQLLNKLLAPVSLTIQQAIPVLSLEWNSIPDKIYELQTSQNLQDWTPLVSSLKATGTVQVWRTNISAAKQFFKVNSDP